MAYTPQPATHGATSAQYRPRYDEQELPPDYFTGFQAGTYEARLPEEEARQAWNRVGNSFMRGEISHGYWFGYQQGSGRARREPGFPRL